MRLLLMHQLQTQLLFFAAAVDDSACLCCNVTHTNTMIMYELFYVYECVRICRSSSFTSLHCIPLTFVATIDSFCLPTLTLTAITIAPYIADRIINISIIIMRINILALAAIVQLSSLPFASANKCRKDLADYHCGAGYQEDGYFDINPDTNECLCCCRQEDGGGYHENTCDGIKSSDKGCGSCMGERACYDASNSKIGDKSCVHQWSCKEMMDSFIKEYSCRSQSACEGMERTHVGTHSCGIGNDNTEACYKLWDSTIGDNSCREFESCSCKKASSYNPPPKTRELYHGSDRCTDHDRYGTNVKIGNNACNWDYVCSGCENDSNVPDDACNGNKLDTFVSPDGYTICNYCSVSSTKKSAG